MNDVARRAGVGVGTVSRVVNHSSSVTPETRARVEHAIDELGFRRNEIARSLRPGQAPKTIGMVAGDLTNPFYATVVKGAIAAAARQGYAVVIAMADEDPEAERLAIRGLLARGVAGLLLVPDKGDHGYMDQRGEGMGVPTVMVDRPASGVTRDVVLFDNEAAGRIATEHLLMHGHTRIGVLVAPSHYTTGWRLRGFRNAMRGAGQRVDDALVLRLREGSSQSAEEGCRRLLARADAPSALFTTTSFLTLGALRAMRSVPVHPALVGFDDFPYAELLPTPITVVAGDAEDLGWTAATRLLRRIEEHDLPVARLMLPVTLRERGSGEAAPSVDLATTR
ncbi:LacI family DNA-binding transcriptional regulator [Humibacter ginsenosidimutans]|uniref:LacI family transcriptional regulator n=1 Tax=Humibacter ginsenosidimutans TaxID=2599293 RepID=A0A5B8M2T8_9MICO|nr:LacI family DNA-binding transcriptional regulator [Humibacter ginsenosidimutans]QDZ15108.1 LacI family transcriptional regulator [Humibacter ginsenosidimutans]